MAVCMYTHVSFAVFIYLDTFFEYTQILKFSDYIYRLS